MERFISVLGIKTANMDQPIRELSGGNQQKVLLARWLATEPDLLILDEPTRGVDVGAKLEIQAIIRRYVDRGFGVVLISSEFEELVEGADRIVVLQDGYSVSVTTLQNPGVTEDALVNAIAHHTPGGGRLMSDEAMPKTKAVAARQTAPIPINLRDHGGLIALIVLIVFNILVTPNFLQMQTLFVNISQVATIAIVAIGMTLVIATAGIDLSVGAVMALAGALAPLIFLSDFGTAYPVARPDRRIHAAACSPPACAACSTV